MEKIEIVGRRYNFEVHKYLYASLVKFTMTHPNDVEWRDGTIIISNKELVIELRNLLVSELEILLAQFYQKPNHKHISKFSNRYRKIELNGAKYTVDYTSNFFGSMVYSIFCLVQWIDNDILSTQNNTN